MCPLSKNLTAIITIIMPNDAHTQFKTLFTTIRGFYSPRCRCLPSAYWRAASAPWLWCCNWPWPPACPPGGLRKHTEEESERRRPSVCVGVGELAFERSSADTSLIRYGKVARQRFKCIAFKSWELLQCLQNLETQGSLQHTTLIHIVNVYRAK